MEMINRFRGKEGNKRFISALRKQSILHNNELILKELAEKSELIQVESGDKLITQDGADNDIYFILAGRLSIVVNGWEVAIRDSGQCVGEMALIDPSARRSASVVATEQTVVAKISEDSFCQLADKHPKVWQLIAGVLADRLRQRNKLVISKNPRPVIFIGSSQESLPIGRAIRSNFDHDDYVLKLWTDKVFGPSRFPIADLEQMVQEADFAVLVLGPDDKVESRNEKFFTPRDNVILELGLFIGALSHERTFMVIPRDCDIKIPTDLLGLTTLSYKSDDSNNLNALLGPACDELRDRINEMAVK
ncbi:cyclic nucleotide-binding protein [Candidatus Poribacteria bacterium]|nr:MAG: cyclic nucleotide-binding protein [Candidatus Poribacteria bacterium]